MKAINKYLTIEQKEEYPIFKVNDKGEVFRFDNEYEGIQIFGNALYNLINPMHQNLKPIPYNKERGFYHKQPVWVKDSGNYEVAFAFVSDRYEIEDGQTYFTYINSNSDYFSADSEDIKPITLEQLKVMPFIWELYKQLED